MILYYFINIGLLINHICNILYKSSDFTFNNITQCLRLYNTSIIPANFVSQSDVQIV